MNVQPISQNWKSFSCSNCNILVMNQSGIITRWYDDKIFFYALTCPSCGFIETFKNDKSIHETKEFNDDIKNLDGTNLKIFNEIKFNANNHKWQTVIMYSRLLIMHIAIDQSKKNNDKKEFKNFKESIDYLEKQKNLNPTLHGLLNNVRKIGNSINHDYESFKKENEEEISKKAKLCYQVVVDVLNNLYKYIHLHEKII